MPGRFAHVLSVIAAGSEAAAASAAIHARVAQAVETGGGVDWLAPGHAFDIGFDGDTKAALAAAREAASGAPLDINVIATAGRKKRVLVADMDSTIISCECIDELADLAGLKAPIAAITARAMKGELGFEDSLRERVSLLKGIGVDRLEQVFRERVRLNPGARTLVATMRAYGARTVLVSGGFRYFTSRVAAAAGFARAEANELIEENGVLAGTVREPVLGREAKLRALEDEVRGAGLSVADAVAVGDGANDLAMVSRAGLGVAWHAKPVLAAAAAARIEHGDLTAVLYLQGYRAGELVEP
ncbi:MAG: phosphoserine phosphatase SerB [Alphaproteobacteria bacterium]|nr:phosphoserine phosphatase SerB [Alphaproteobacteria bacterium]